MHETRSTVSWGEALDRACRAVERVQQRLRRVVAALQNAGIPYAIVGGNAVASWVARVDPSAVRTTRDVDVLVRRAELDRVTQALTSIGYHREDLRDLIVFTDPEEPSRRSGIHLVWAGERLRPSYNIPSPDVTEAEADQSGMRVVTLEALVRMKLTSFRDHDRMHLRDLIDVGLVEQSWVPRLPAELAPRLQELLDTPNG